jgi:hypothetical protein
MNQQNKNAINALLNEYEKAIVELQKVIKNISSDNLVQVLDVHTKNPDCISIQTILTHVVAAGYSYCVYIQNSRNIEAKRPERVPKTSALKYSKQLDDVLAYTYKTFLTIDDEEIEIIDNAKKISTFWGQLYDIEQLMEHSIVHVLRHRRQIEKFKIQLSSI